MRQPEIFRVKGYHFAVVQRKRENKLRTNSVTMRLDNYMLFLEKDISIYLGTCHLPLGVSNEVFNSTVVCCD